ncbi:MAG: hypothetical protein ABIH83_01340 [Candidatus Micrarchaeota archaeon]
MAKLCKIVMMVVLLLPMLFSGTCDISAVEKYIEPNMSCYTNEFSTPTQQFAIVIIEGNETFLVNNEEGRILENEKEIEDALVRNIVFSAGYQAAYDRTDEAVENLHNNKTISKELCYRMTGMDRHPCDDKETCIFAALSTPISSSALYGQGFWESMLAYKHNCENLQGGIDKMKYLLANKKEESGYAKEMAGNISEIIELSEKFEDNALLLTIADENCTGLGARTCFEYCPKLNWSVQQGEWDGIHNTWITIEFQLEDIEFQSGRAMEILLRTREWKEYSESKYSIWNNAKGELGSIKLNVSASLSTENALLVNDSTLEEEYAQWLLGVDETTELAKSGEVYNALKRKRELEAGAENIIEKSWQNSQKVQNIRNSIENANKTIAKLDNSNESVELRGEYEEFVESVEYPINASGLDGMENRAEEIEEGALILLGKSQITPVQNQTQNATVGGNGKGQKDVVSKISDAIAQIIEAIMSLFG